MAVKFDANGEYLNRSGFVTASAWTMACWARLDTDTNAYSSIFGAMLPGAPAAWSFLTLAADGEQIMGANAGVDDALGELVVVGDWYYLAMTRSGTTITLYVSHSGAAFATDIGGTQTANWDAGWQVLVGDADHEFASIGDTPFRGTVAHARFWTAALSQAELEAERDAAAAVRTSNLWADWPLLNDADDDSGNARSLTVNGSSSWVTGPLFVDEYQLSSTVRFA